MNVAAPPYSPPVEKPWIRRSARMAIGAPSPMLWYVGRQPTRNVQPDISRMVIARTRWRPILSPSGPKNAPPNGRTMKPTATRASDLSTALPSPGKKTVPMLAAMAPEVKTP